jgi:hypothetical protein
VSVFPPRMVEKTRLSAASWTRPLALPMADSVLPPRSTKPKAFSPDGEGNGVDPRRNRMGHDGLVRLIGGAQIVTQAQPLEIGPVRRTRSWP